MFATDGRGILELLKASPVFAGVPAPELAALARVARDEMYRAREYVFLEADPAEWVRATVMRVAGVERVEVVLTFDPPWTPERILV